MRKTYVYKNGRILKKIDSEKTCLAPHVLTDIAPYRSMVTGEHIDGRAMHRQHLKKHGCIEVGNG